MKIDTEFERRLREILTEYPEIDPRWAALALKGQPEATNEQIAHLITQLSKFSPVRSGAAPGKVDRSRKPSKRTATPPDLARVLEE